MRITVVGTGYVGLVTGACLADSGHEVICVDLDTQKIDNLKRGVIPIFEPGLERIVHSNMASGSLVFTSDLAASVAVSDVVFIAVGTPAQRGEDNADLSYIYAAVSDVARAVDGFTVVVTKSTVPVGTGDEVERIMRVVNPFADVAIVSNPEFLREGQAISDFKVPDRIVVGLEEERARTVMAEVYRPLYLDRVPVLYTDRRTAELTKYAGNAFLAMKISFINEIADLCEKTGADVQDLARGIGLDHRIGGKFLNAGPGFGGSCFPKDTRALITTGRSHGVALRLVEATVTANERRRRAMGQRVIAACGGDVRGKTIGILGLTFKPNTDDMREAPSIDIIQSLIDGGANVRAFDPCGTEAARKIFNNVDLTDDPYRVADGADCLVVVTEWDLFRSLDLSRLKVRMATPSIVDLRNVYSAAALQAAGFAYSCVGRPSFRAGLELVTEAAE